MTTDILSAISIGFFLSFVLGPVFFVLIETSISKGFKAAAALNTGVILSDVIFILVGYFSSKQLVENINNQPGLFVLGGVVLVIYGGYIFINRNKREEKISVKEVKENYLNLFLKGFGLNIINIAVLMSSNAFLLFPDKKYDIPLSKNAISFWLFKLIAVS